MVDKIEILLTLLSLYLQEGGLLAVTILVLSYSARLNSPEQTNEINWMNIKDKWLKLLESHTSDLDTDCKKHKESNAVNDICNMNFRAF